MNSNTAIALLTTLKKEMDSKRTREEAIRELAGFISAVSTDDDDALFGGVIKESCMCAAIDVSVSIINGLPSERNQEVK